MKQLLFIDTNILLDFYRMQNREGGVSKILSHIDSSHENIITTQQVQMEYKKNRQRAIRGSLSKFEKPNWSTVNFPDFLLESQSAKKMKNVQKVVEEEAKRMKARLERLIKNPSLSDPVYKVLRRLFAAQSPYNLINRDDDEHERIRQLAFF